jgi:hypothetical protein
VGQALSLQDQHHLVVRVAVLRCPAGRDLAHELGGRRAASTGTEQDPELPVSGRLHRALVQVTAERRANTGRPVGFGRPVGSRGGQRHDIQPQRCACLGLDPELRARRDPQAQVRPEHRASLAVQLQPG